MRTVRIPITLTLVRKPVFCRAEGPNLRVGSISRILHEIIPEPGNEEDRKEYKKRKEKGALYATDAYLELRFCMPRSSDMTSLRIGNPNCL